MSTDTRSGSCRTATGRRRTCGRARPPSGSGRAGVAVRVPKEEARAIGMPELGFAPDEFLDGLDLVVSLGGDGTMLHAVDLVYPAPVPILGVNVGQLGYLTDVEPEELEPSMPRLLAGDFAVLERMVLVGRRASRADRPRARGSRSTKRRSRSSAAATSSGSTCRSTAARSRRTRPTA